MSAYAEYATLAYRAWLESKSRFLLSVVWIVGLCVAFIVFHAQIRAYGAPDTAGSYTRFIYLRVYGGFIRGSFLFLALILGLGGLQRERQHGTLGFTLDRDRQVDDDRREPGWRRTRQHCRHVLPCDGREW